MAWRAAPCTTYTRISKSFEPTRSSSVPQSAAVAAPLLVDFMGPLTTTLSRLAQYEFDAKRDAKLAEVAAETPDYLMWMIGADDMDAEVIEVVRAALGQKEPKKGPVEG